MVDFNMDILNNPNLGENSNLPFLDETEAQIAENKQAEAEGREPRKVLRRERFGDYAGSHEVGPIEYSSNEEPEVTETTEEQYFTDQETAKDAPLIALEEEQKNSEDSLQALLEEYKEETETNE